MQQKSSKEFDVHGDPKSKILSEKSQAFNPGTEIQKLKRIIESRFKDGYFAAIITGGRLRFEPLTGPETPKNELPHTV